MKKTWMPELISEIPKEFKAYDLHKVELPYLRECIIRDYGLLRKPEQLTKAISSGVYMFVGTAKDGFDIYYFDIVVAKKRGNSINVQTEKIIKLPSAARLKPNPIKIENDVKNKSKKEVS